MQPDMREIQNWERLFGREWILVEISSKSSCGEEEKMNRRVFKKDSGEARNSSLERNLVFNFNLPDEKRKRKINNALRVKHCLCFERLDDAGLDCGMGFGNWSVLAEKLVFHEGVFLLSRVGYGLRAAAARVS